MIAAAFMELALPVVDDAGTTHFTLTKAEDIGRVQQLFKLQFAWKPLPATELLPDSGQEEKTTTTEKKKPPPRKMVTRIR